ncbi:IS66 family insertion sequence element accessory protein TnpB [Neorhizobium galegae]|uniref:IS66 family insertion sequence element accessory protein TnpB n=1 Tax=Neorhizobium galegae TaxID=399 RepID=UPI001289F403|nr:IS66 family insertion sequence element accessory protein TnpB [Neorhizobium galegae]KAA9382329.1 IS66 family insertion sequence element accessory protein TnpB [Neorhizobium galegae]KAB1109180.1 IS66 family insertion sequence element accessory protein TnpB [Neorhizobium galegae]MCQ1774772.1 IS66 family insertion sequence element accessory protein TnpB [Neorhizobium galegae]MCQ1800202.1 IS66 family insertion sequence element accessory protein TnpB [Neorhizobium galegae]
MIPSGVKVFLASHPIDFRKGPDSLLSLVRDAGSDPFNGALYVFRAKRADRVKIVWWDGSGVCLYANDLHSYCISLSDSVEGFGLSGIFFMRGGAIDELVPSTALLLR